jgi:trigger factor
MQVTETLSEGLKRAFTVVVPAADIESRREARLTDLGKQLRLPGFRPGKVPLPVVRQRYGSAVTAEVLEESVNDAARQVMSDRGLRAAMQPRIDLVNADPARDLEFKLELELLPEIQLPDLTGLELVRRKAEVSEEALNTALANLARRNRTAVPTLAEELGERGAAPGEVAQVDYVGRIEGVEFPGGSGTDVDVEIGGAGFIPGFAEQLEGIRPGGTRSITVTFPEGYGVPDVAGKTAVFEVTGKAVKRIEEPAMDEAFATRLGFENLEELKDFVRRQIQREYDEMSRLGVKRELLDRLNDMVSFTLPDGLVEGEFSQIWNRIEADRKAGKLDEEDRAKDEETLRTEYRRIAERRVRLGLLIAEIGRVDGIVVGQDELTRAMRTEARRYPGQEERMMEFFRKNPSAAETLRGPIFEEKVVDFILGQARVTETVVPPEELAAEPAEKADAAGEETGAATEVQSAEGVE